MDFREFGDVDLNMGLFLEHPAVSKNTNSNSASPGMASDLAPMPPALDDLWDEYGRYTMPFGVTNNLNPSTLGQDQDQAFVADLSALDMNMALSASDYALTSNLGPTPSDDFSVKLEGSDIDTTDSVSENIFETEKYPSPSSSSSRSGSACRFSSRCSSSVSPAPTHASASTSITKTLKNEPSTNYDDDDDDDSSIFNSENGSPNPQKSASSNTSKSPKPTKVKQEKQQSKLKAKGSKIIKPKKEKSSHNMIEKKYRTNINDKIMALRDSVPSLRCLVTNQEPIDLDGLTPASKLNKATVLTKATEYIHHLKQRNEMLLRENEELRKCEIMRRQQQQRCNPQMPMMPMSNMNMNNLQMNMDMNPGINMGFDMDIPMDIPSFIQRRGFSMPELPENNNNNNNCVTDPNPQLLSPQSQPQSRQNSHSSLQTNNRSSNLQSNNNQNPSITQSLPSKLLMVSMAGVMGTNLMSDFTDTKGLSIFPIGFINNQQLHSFFSFLKLALVIGSIITMFFPFLLSSLSSSSTSSNDSKLLKTKQHLKFLEHQKILNSDSYNLIERSRSIWDIKTSNFNLNYPIGNISSQISLYLSFFLQSSIVLLFGKNSLFMFQSFINNDTTTMIIDDKYELEKSNAIKTCLEVQLCGGDLNISKSRLIFSLFQNLLNDLNHSNNNTKQIKIIDYMRYTVLFGVIFQNTLFEKIGKLFMKMFWNKANDLLNNDDDNNNNQKDDEILKPHLKSLLQTPFSEIFENSQIINLVYDLCWNNDEHMLQMLNLDEGYYSIIKDGTISNILDVLSAVVSSFVLRGLLVSKVLEINKEQINNDNIHEEEEEEENPNKGLDYCFSLAPKNSIQYRRCLVAKGLLSTSNDSLDDIKSAITLTNDELYVDGDLDNSESNDINNKPNTFVQCQMLKVKLTKIESLESTIIFNSLNSITSSEIDLLSFTAIYQALSTIKLYSLQALLSSKFENQLEAITGLCRIWIGASADSSSSNQQNQQQRQIYSKSGMSIKEREDVVEVLINMGRSFGGVLIEDEGYGSQ